MSSERGRSINNNDINNIQNHINIILLLHYLHSTSCYYFKTPLKVLHCPHNPPNNRDTGFSLQLWVDSLFLQQPKQNYTKHWGHINLDGKSWLIIKINGQFGHFEHFILSFCNWLTNCLFCNFLLSWSPHSFGVILP